MAATTHGLTRPGGRIGFGELPPVLDAESKRLKALVTTELGEQGGLLRFLDAADFMRAFVDSVPSPQRRERYALETAKFALGKPADQDQVLVFRRTAPALPNQPKPERDWTTDYIQAANGLRQEIPSGPARWYSQILCSTLGEVSRDGLAPASGAATDGELKTLASTYAQDRALFAFRTASDEAQLTNYLRSPDALTLAQILDRLTAEKTTASFAMGPSALTEGYGARSRAKLASDGRVVAAQSSQIQARFGGRKA